MTNLITNACTRCGKERMEVKRYKEKINNSLVTHIITACPDAECQKLVNLQIKKEVQKRLQNNFFPPKKGLQKKIINSKLKKSN